MSEEIKSLKELFLKTRQNFEEAVEKRESEKISTKIDRFRVSEDGEFEVRILPLAPILDENGQPSGESKKGYEYPVQQQFLKIKLPAKEGKKAKFVSIPVVRTTQKGVDYPVDIIDTYVKIAKEFDDEVITKKISENSYSGGLKWNYQHAMYVLDLNKNRKGPLLYTCSGAQYHALDEEKFSIWGQLHKNNVKRDDFCPLSDFYEGYDVTIKRYEESKQTKYKFSINAIAGPDPLKEEELSALIKAPRIPDEIYRYTRYQFEATLEFLKQYDQMLEIAICEEQDFKEAVEQLRDALPKDDTSHFNMSDAGKDKKGSNSSDEITIDSLNAEYDAIEAAGLGEKSDEYKELREKIAQFIQDNNLDIRISHSKKNGHLLDEIEDMLDNNAAPAPVKKDEKEEEVEEEAPKRKSRNRPSDDDVDDKEEAPESAPEPEDDPEPESDPEPENEPEPEPAPRRRRQRPSEEEPADDPEPEASEEEEAKEEAPRRRRRR